MLTSRTKRALTRFQHRLAANPTTAELLVIRELKRRRIPFQFQAAVPHNHSFYILDFYLPTKRVILECDGFSHTKTQTKDKSRDVFFRHTYNTPTIRIPNELCYADVRRTIQIILDSLNN